MSALGCDFAQVYGLTETTGAITSLMPARPRSRRSPLRSPAIGRATLRPCGAADRRHRHRAGRCPIGEVGEVWTRSDQNMLGLLEQGRRDRGGRSHEDGWFRTGDAGWMDADGYLFLHDRIKDMIVSGGENIYPAEVENALLAHPAVADAAVIGVPDDRWGETVKAIVVRSPDASDDDEALEADIIAATRARVGPLQVPDLGRLHRRCSPATPRARCSSVSCASPTGPAGNATSTERRSLRRPRHGLGGPDGGSERPGGVAPSSGWTFPRCLDDLGLAVIVGSRDSPGRRPARSTPAGGRAPPPACGCDAADGRARRRCRWPAPTARPGGRRR